MYEIIGRTIIEFNKCLKEKRKAIKEIKEILTWLAHDEREGRMSGKQGNISAAKFIKEKFESFGFETHTIDGHNFEQLRQVFAETSNRPRVIIANTIKGKGVSYMEDVWQYHTIIPKSEDDIKQGLEELS